MEKSYFLALPSKACDPRYKGPNAEEFIQLLAAMRQCGFHVECPLEEADWEPDSLPGKPSVTMRHRLDTIRSVDRVIAFPKAGDETSPGIMMYVGYAVGIGKPVTVVLNGEDGFDQEWQLAGLSHLKRRDDLHLIDLISYTGSIVHCWDKLRDAMLGTSRTMEKQHSALTDCPFGLDYAWYWEHRTDLFAKWFDGKREVIHYDKVGLCTVKPKRIATEIAHSFSGVRVLDAFAGIGGVAIALARSGKTVLAVESDAARCKMLRENVRLYGVDESVEIINADVLELYQDLDFDCLYLDPSWGGPSYRDTKSFRFNHFKAGRRTSGSFVKNMIRHAFERHREVGITLPNNFHFPELTQLHRSLCRKLGTDERQLRLQWGQLKDRVLFMTVFM